MDYLRKASCLVKAVVVCFIIFVPLLLMNIVQVFSFFLLYPFSGKLFRNLNVALAGSWWGGCEWLLRKAGGVDVKVTGDELPIEENVILISNHQGWGDIPMLFKLAPKKGEKNWKYEMVCKDALKYLPAIGWGMIFLDCLFVKRSWQKNKAKMEATFKKFLTTISQSG